MRYEGHNLRDPLFDQLARLAGRFAQPVCFPDPGKNAFRNGSGFLVCLGGRTFGVTCHHVIAEYRETRGPAPVPTLEFGRARIDPEEHLVAESPDLDVVTLDLTRLVGQPNGIDPASCIVPREWPPEELDAEDVLALAGFPGIGREQVESDYFRFHLFSAGTTAVASRGGPTHFYTRIDLEDSIVGGVRPDVSDDLGGLSGGPVFVWRKTPILVAELVGIIKEYQADLDLMYVRRASCLRSVGTLRVEA